MHFSPQKGIKHAQIFLILFLLYTTLPIIFTLFAKFCHQSMYQVLNSTLNQMFYTAVPLDWPNLDVDLYKWNVNQI